MDYYGGMSGRYSSADVGNELKSAGWRQEAPPGYMPSLDQMSASLGRAPATRSTMAAPGGYSMGFGGATPPPPQHSGGMPYGAGQYPYFPGQQMPHGSPGQMHAPLMAEAGVTVDTRHGAQSLISERLKGEEPNYTINKVFKAPETIVRERERNIRKPAIVERIIEVPKPEIVPVIRPGPPVIKNEEQIIEVPQIVEEIRIIRVPKKEIQERLIEVPKIEWEEVIEYDDRIEYREVCVDKIVEVPEIEYVIKEIETLVPQSFIEEYFVDNYKEMPMVQVQEVERTENVPTTFQLQQFQADPVPQPVYQPVFTPPAVVVPQQQPVYQQPVYQQPAFQPPAAVPYPQPMVQAPVYQSQAVLSDTVQQSHLETQKKGHWKQVWVDDGEETVTVPGPPMGSMSVMQGQSKAPIQQSYANYSALRGSPVR